MRPIDHMALRLESLRPRIEGIERRSEIPELSHELYHRVWEKLLPKLDRYAWESGEADGIVITTAQNIVRDMHRRKRAVTGSQEATEMKSKHPGPEMLLELQEFRLAVRSAVRALPEDQRMLIKRRYWGTVSCDRALTSSQRAALMHAREKLRSDPKLRAFMK